MEQILLAYGLPKETFTTTMMFNKNTKVKVSSPDGDTDFFDIVAGVLQWESIGCISVHNLPRLYTLNINRSNERKWPYTKNARTRRYPAQTTMDADYADDIVLLANRPNQAKSLLQSLEQEAAGIGLLVNADKMKYMCFIQGDISTLNSGSLKLEDKFTYLGSSILSTKSDIKMHLAKLWTPADRLLIRWISDQSDKIKQFLPNSSYVNSTIWM